MANTYTQIYIHIVFAVHGRFRLIRRSWKDALERYMTGIVQNRGHKLVGINCQPDHAHLVIGLNPKDALSDLVREIKSSSSKHANEERWPMGRFQWQEGYGAFSVGRSMLSSVAEYVANQAEHHGNKTFGQEFRSLLEKYEVEYDEAYLFEEVDPKDLCDAQK